MRRTLVALLAAAFLAATVGPATVGPAAAARLPTRAEGVGLRAAVAAFIRAPRSPAARDNRISSIVVSQVDARYAAVRLVSRSVGASEMVLHRAGTGWNPAAFGSSPGCDAAPRAELADLRVGCSPPGGSVWVSDCGPLVIAPRTLTLACADANFALADLRWRSWGARRATARGWPG